MLKEDLKAEAYALGFSHAGITTLHPPLHFAAYLDWLTRGDHAGMDYLARPDAINKRANPSLLLPVAKSVLCLAMKYAPPEALPPMDGYGRVAAYAWRQDYHLVIPAHLNHLMHRFEQVSGRKVAHQGFTDSAPLMERDLAQRAGLGWIGKNTCLIHPKGGSYFFLAEILMDLELEPDPPMAADRCGTCTRCIQACPTGCIQPDRTIDARRCIAYHTIENKGIIPRDLRPLMGSWIFGCDLCQMACPWNRHAANHIRKGASPVDAFSPILQDELPLSAEQFNQRFKGSPILRAKRRGYLRNVAVALGNQPDPHHLPALAEVLAHEPEALVRAHALWAVLQHHTPMARLLVDRVRATESDPLVLAELA